MTSTSLHVVVVFRSSRACVLSSSIACCWWNSRKNSFHFSPSPSPALFFFSFTWILSAEICALGRIKVNDRADCVSPPSPSLLAGRSCRRSIIVKCFPAARAAAVEDGIFTFFSYLSVDHSPELRRDVDLEIISRVCVSCTFCRAAAAPIQLFGRVCNFYSSFTLVRSNTKKNTLSWAELREIPKNQHGWWGRKKKTEQNGRRRMLLWKTRNNIYKNET